MEEADGQARADGQEPLPVCPFCQATETRRVSLFGSQLLMSQHQCRRCGSYFEAVRHETERPAAW